MCDFVVNPSPDDGQTLDICRHIDDHIHEAPIVDGHWVMFIYFLPACYIPVCFWCKTGLIDGINELRQL